MACNSPWPTYSSDEDICYIAILYTKLEYGFEDDQNRVYISDAGMLQEA